MKNNKNTVPVSVSMFHSLGTGVIFYTILLLSCVSCTQQTSNKSNSSTSYFDLASLIKKDIADNTKNRCGEIKTVYVNTTGETKQLDSINWQKELQPLLECDINKPAWRDKFQVDTFKNNFPDMTIQYHSLSDKINVRTLTVQLKDKEIQRITISKKTRSFIFSSEQMIAYIPGKGFSVRGVQRAFMMKNFDLNVDVKYNCK